MENYIVKNGQIVLKDRIVHGFDLVVRNGIIYDISQEKTKYAGLEMIDAENNYIIPGLVELHIHGCGAFGAESGEPKVVEKMADFLSKHGINTFLPTLQCDETSFAQIADELNTNPRLKKYVEGIYLEGPFISYEKRGGILPQNIRDVDIDKLKHLIDISKGFLRMMTIAPELAQSEMLFRELLKSGIIPCFGHSNCNIESITNGMCCGKRNMTHLFNAMSGISHKMPGLAMLPFFDREVFFELNSDGIHLNREIIKICYENLNHGRLILITDAVISAGKKYGKYHYYDKAVISDENGVRYAENDVLIGSNCLINNVLKRFIEFTKAPIEKAVRFATYNPCCLLGISDKKGSIEIGKVADLLIVDKNIRLIRNLYAA